MSSERAPTADCQDSAMVSEPAQTSRLAAPTDADADAMQVDGESAPAIIRRPSQAGDKPRGILKRQPSTNVPAADADGAAPAASSTGEPQRAGVSWNEANLYNNEASRDSTMKINEPKTPYVQWNPETDEVMNIHQIPGFELGLAESVRSSSTGTAAPTGEGSGASVSNSASDRSGPSSRHSSFSGSRHSSFSGEKKVDIEVPDDHRGGGSIDTDDFEGMDDEAREKHRQFKNMRKNHYGSEADAMRQAQILIDQEEALELDDEDDAPPRSNGAVPPVPALPNGHA